MKSSIRDGSRMTALHSLHCKLHKISSCPQDLTKEFSRRGNKSKNIFRNPILIFYLPFVHKHHTRWYELARDPVIVTSNQKNDKYTKILLFRIDE